MLYHYTLTFTEDHMVGKWGTRHANLDNVEWEQFKCAPQRSDFQGWDWRVVTLGGYGKICA